MSDLIVVPSLAASIASFRFSSCGTRSCKISLSPLAIPARHLLKVCSSLYHDKRQRIEMFSSGLGAAATMQADGGLGCGSKLVRRPSPLLLDFSSRRMSLSCDPPSLRYAAVAQEDPRRRPRFGGCGFV